MALTLNRNDITLLTLLAEYKILTVSQLAALSDRSRQVIRRRVRVLGKNGHLSSKLRGYGKGRGRPEEIIFITNQGLSVLQTEGIISEQDRSMIGNNEQENLIFVDHDLLSNWFRISLLYTEKVAPGITTHYLSPNSLKVKSKKGGRPLLLERIPVKGRQKKHIEFIPDGVFSLTARTEEISKSLLFFLEVDMGTETLASPKRDSNDIRQKILNYHGLFRSSRYKRYEKIFDKKLRGFRLLFLTNSNARFKALCRLVQQMPPSNFIWITDQERLFTYGPGGKIWIPGGKDEDQPQSIFGSLACEAPVISDIR